jgi:hypothetical protein
VILKTGARQFPVNLYVARAKLEFSVYQINRAAREARRQVRAEVERAVALYAARNHDARERLVDRQLQVRVLLVILEQHVVARLVLLDQVRLKHQRLDLVIRDDELKIMYPAD